MNSARRVLPKALSLILLAVTFGVSVATAQFYEPSVSSLGLTSSSLARSPRLLGMGKLQLVVDDRDASINLWDFAQNPMGIATDDTVSTLDLRPGTDAAHGAHLLLGPNHTYREDLAARTMHTQIEAFHRDAGGTTFGGVFQANSVRFDRPFSDNIEVRRGISAPSIAPVLSGRFPYMGGGKLRYAVRGRFQSERRLDEYRRILTNGAGQFIGLDGLTLNPPDYFSPDEYKVSSTAFGAFVSYDVHKDHVLAFGLDAVNQKWKGTNAGFKSASQIDEKRPYKVGQATLVGHFGKSLEYGVDGHGWLSTSQQDWRFTLSAGVGADPLTGRGKLLEREEKGSRLDSRVKWRSGAATIGGQLWTSASKVTMTPPGASDLTSLNRFLNVVSAAVGGDTLSLPDSVVAGETRTYAWGYGAGVGYKFARATVGSEFHWGRDLSTSLGNGLGPKQVGWDVRAGLEYLWTNAVAVRTGYLYRSYDEDDLTRSNEYGGHTGTIGLGVKPVGTTWSVESGYAIEWLVPDFGDPSHSQRSRQNLSLQVHWGF
ncbi:MAG: hypothetical protein ABIR01_06365 [Candidatus Eisenbacteria bacterium]